MDARRRRRRRFTPRNVKCVPNAGSIPTVYPLFCRRRAAGREVYGTYDVHRILSLQATFGQINRKGLLQGRIGRMYARLFAGQRHERRTCTLPTARVHRHCARARERILFNFTSLFFFFFWIPLCRLQSVPAAPRAVAVLQRYPPFDLSSILNSASELCGAHAHTV